MQITKDIIAYYDCPFAFENLQSGLLKTRDVVKDVPFTDTSYCQYGYPYRKHTRIWHSLGDYLDIRPMCSLRNPCDIVRACGTRAMSAHRGRAKKMANE